MKSNDSWSSVNVSTHLASFSTTTAFLSSLYQLLNEVFHISGESERAVRQCFERARNSSPCVIFFDEIDSLCPKRSSVEVSCALQTGPILTEALQFIRKSTQSSKIFKKEINDNQYRSKGPSSNALISGADCLWLVSWLVKSDQLLRMHHLRCCHPSNKLRVFEECSPRSG